MWKKIVGIVVLLVVLILGGTWAVRALRGARSVCQRIYEQAAAYMPAPNSGTLDDIRAGNSAVISWLDERGNQIELYFPAMEDGENMRVVCVAIHISSEDYTFLEIPWKRAI